MPESVKEPVKLNKWDGNAVKNALDDAIRKAIKEKFKYTEKTALIDLRLCLAFVAVGFALYALIWDWLFPFPKSCNILIVCVAAYFLMMAVLQAYSQWVEGTVFFVCCDDDRKWYFSSKIKKYDHMYELEIRVVDKQRENRSQISKSFSSWIDEDGRICDDVFNTEIFKLHDSLLAQKKEK